MRRRPLPAVPLVAAATVALAGCNAYDDPSDDPVAPTDWIVEQAPGPGPADPFPADSDLGPAVPGPWFCTYEPALDDDWRDDVVCSNGVEDHLPYLDEWDPLLTEEEIWDAVIEYEDYLNASFPAQEGG